MVLPKEVGGGGGLQPKGSEGFFKSDLSRDLRVSLKETGYRRSRRAQFESVICTVAAAFVVFNLTV